MKKLFTCIIILLFSIFANLDAAEVFVYNFDVTSTDQSGTAKNASDDEGIQRLSSLIQKSFSSLSSSDITYMGLAGQVSNKVTGTVRVIQNTVNALAVCFFFNVEYVMYGEIQIDQKTNKYTTQIKVYSKTQNEVVYELKYAKPVPKDEPAYTNELADVVDGQLRSTLQSLPLLPSEQRINDIQKKLSDSEKKKQDDERLLTFMDKLLDTIQKNDPSSQDGLKDKTKTGEPPANTEKVFGFYVGIGYFFELSGVWKDITLPLTSVQTGPKWNLLLINLPFFDLYFRPAFLVDYSISMNTPGGGYNYYSKTNSLGGSLAIDFFFEFGDVIGFSLGGGVEYSFDFIDFREGVVKDYYSYFTNALGVYGCLGLEFVLGNEKNLVLGVNNIIHFDFYDTMYSDYKIMIISMYKI